MGTQPAVVNPTAGSACPMSGSSTRGLVAVALAVATGAVLRLWPRPALWLDEAQSVAFAREPFGSIPRALRQDGAPPLYYLFLRAWTNVFGTSTTAVRSLSVFLSFAALAVLVAVAQRLWGRRAAATVLILASTSSFAIRYASETRMYSLVTLEVAGGIWFVVRWMNRRRPGDLIALAVSVAALLYTHYWGLYLIVTVLLVLSAAAKAPARRQIVAPIAAAVIAGCALWLPWVPSFRFQSRHTATPWAQPARLGDIFLAIGLRTGWGALWRSIVVVLLAGAVVVALLQMRSPKPPRVVPSRDSQLMADERPRLLRPLLAVTLVCPLVAVAGGAISNSAYTVRYTAVVFPFAMLVVGAAGAMLRPLRLGAAVVVVVAGLSTAVAIHEIGVPRTTASRVAAELRPLVRRGDVLIYCPDQLAPAMSRVLSGDSAFAGVHQEVYPDGHPARVDWIDYRSRYQSADPIRAASRYETLAGESTIWLIWSATYPPTQGACTDLFNELRSTRPSSRLVVGDDPSISDHESLWEFK